MIDIESFWRAFKCSWLRRLLSTSGFWPKILEIELQKLNSSIQDLLFSGPSKLLELAKNLGNICWKNLLQHLAFLLKEAIYSNPESFYLFPIWNNPIFKNARKVLYKPNEVQVASISLVADFYLAPGVLLTSAQLNAKFGTSFNPRQLSKIHQALENALTVLNLNLGLAEWHCEPRQSIIIQIARKYESGCKAFYTVLRARLNDRVDTTRAEVRWHEQLASIMSIDFWNSVLRLNANLKNNNCLKWLQYQIVRNTVFTNNRVSKFKNTVSDRCDLCTLETETSYHLFYLCPVSQRFWAETKQYLDKFNLFLPVTRLQILFGIITQTCDSVLNTFILLGKHLIWTCKHSKKIPNLNHFKNSLAAHLNNLKVCYVIKSLGHIFDDQWGNILLDLVTQPVQDGSALLHDPQQQ